MQADPRRAFARTFPALRATRREVITTSDSFYSGYVLKTIPSSFGLGSGTIAAMKDKLLWSTVIVLGVLLALGHAQNPVTSGGQIGRYQIVTVAGYSYAEAGVYRIDTVTGKTWVKVRDDTNHFSFAALPDFSKPQ